MHTNQANLQWPAPYDGEKQWAQRIRDGYPARFPNPLASLTLTRTRPNPLASLTLGSTRTNPDRYPEPNTLARTPTLALALALSRLGAARDKPNPAPAPDRLPSPEA